MNPTFLEINGQKIAFYEKGTGKSCIFFIHGNFSSALAFRCQFESCLSDKYRLVALDLPGHGRSEPAKIPHATCSLPGYAKIVKLAVEMMGIENALFVGWSLGGHILLEAAHLLGKAKGFVILGAPPLGNPPDMTAAFLENPATPLMFKNKLTSDEIDFLATAFSHKLPDFFKTDIEISDGHARQALHKNFSQLLFKDEIKTVESLLKPLAIFHGEEDKLINLDYINNLSIPALWQGEIQIISDACHSPQVEAPEEFNALLHRFISDLC